MRSPRGGAAALMVALSASTLGASLALVVDLGVARMIREQLQAGTDAAALSAARRLDGSTAGVSLARATAIEVAGTNTALGEALAVSANPANAADGDVVLGSWDATTGQFQPETDARLTNAVLVRARRDDIVTWFAMLFDRDRMGAAAVSIAVEGPRVGAGRVPYYLPFSLPLCQVESHSAEQLMDMTFVLSPAGADVVGYGAVGTNPSAAWARRQIDAMLPCMHEWSSTGTITQECSQIESGDTVNLGNGEQASSLSYLSSSMSKGIPWNTSYWGALPPQHTKSTVPKNAYGRVLEGPIPIFSGGTGYCTAAARWNETLPVAGFVWGVIYDVAATGSAAQRNVWIRLDVSHVYDVGEWSGGVDAGVTWLAPPVLVW